MDAPTILIAENPHAGSQDGSQLIQRLVDCLKSCGMSVIREQDPERIRCQIQGDVSDEYKKSRIACVVCAGGDGTVGMVANWLDSSTPIAVLPLGTENLFARQLGFDGNIENLCSRIAEADTFSIDAGIANGKLFFVVASVGFDAEVVRLLAARRTGHIRHATWIRPILQALRSYHFPEIRVTTNNQRHPIHTRWAFVLNLPQYALGLQFVSAGDVTDGRLDVCCFRGGRWWNGLRYLTGVIMGWHRTWRDTHVEQATHVVIDSDAAVPYQLDGDPGGELPLEISVVPGRLTVIGHSPSQSK